MDIPKSLGNRAAREARVAALARPHVAPLATLVRELRARYGSDYSIPDFDPHDGGIEADCLFLLEAPGPRAVETGFVSRDNPDETAKNFLLLNAEAGIVRTRTVLWNIVPWYVGSGTKIRPANSVDIRAAEPALAALLSLLPGLHMIVLVGAKAASARRAVSALAPAAHMREIPHPSPLFVNRTPTNRVVLLRALANVALGLPKTYSAG